MREIYETGEAPKGCLDCVKKAAHFVAPVNKCSHALLVFAFLAGAGLALLVLR